ETKRDDGLGGKDVLKDLRVPEQIAPLRADRPGRDRADDRGQATVLDRVHRSVHHAGAAWLRARRPRDAVDVDRGLGRRFALGRGLVDDSHALLLAGTLARLLASVARERLLGAFHHALFLVPRAAVPQLLQTGGLRLRQVEPVDRFGEAEVGVDAGDDDAGVDRDQLDADHGDADVRVDHEPLVED